MDPHLLSRPASGRLRSVGREVGRFVGYGAGLGALAGLGTLAYSAGIEVRNFVVRRVEVMALPAGHRPLRVLHVSDLHLTPYQGRKRRWLSSLAGLKPDLVINTGDNLAHQDSVEPLVEGFGELLDVPGVFVFGSNDYFAPTVRNPLWYLLPDDGSRNVARRQAALARPRRRLREARLERPDQHLGAARGRGHLARLRRGRRPAPRVRRPRRRRGPAPADVDLRIGVAHAPYLRVLDQFARDGYDITFAGHTHGGQVCLPVKGAIVTNCDLETGRAKGLHRHPADSRPGTRGARGCTSRRGPAPRRTPRSGCAAGPRQRCSRCSRGPSEPRTECPK